MKIDITGVLVDNISKDETIRTIDALVKNGQPRYVVTPYSEMIVFASRDEQYRGVLNNAALTVPDGMGILWAAKFLSLLAAVNNQQLKVIVVFWQLVYTLVYTLIKPSYVQSVIKERVVGSHLIWDIARLCAEQGYSLALAGGFNDSATFTALRLKRQFPKLTIRLVLANRDFENGVIEQIKQSNSDILLIAYSPPKQERWLADSIQHLNVKVAIGLGGTFDYISGRRWSAPGFLQAMGLEWLWRLVTQPWRWKRMWNALPVFIWTVYKCKVKGKR